MVADVPLGFFLSGGVDSSVVVAAAAATGTRVATFSIGFDADEVSETPFAREVAQRFGTDHHERILSQAHAQELLPRLKSWFDEPFADESSMPTYLVSAAAREHVTVVLDGRRRRRSVRRLSHLSALRALRALAHLAARPWSTDVCSCGGRFRAATRCTRALTLLETAFSDGPNLWAQLMGGMPTPGEACVSRGARHPARLRRLVALSRVLARRTCRCARGLQYVDFHTFMPGLVLTKVDRTSMAVSLEARVPLLARRIIEFSFGLDEDLRYHGGEPKGPAAARLSRHPARHILDRRKKGFGIPRYYLKDVSGRPLDSRARFLAQALFIWERRRLGAEDR